MTDQTPETLNYLFFSLGATALLMFGYIASLFVRLRSLHQDNDIIDQLAEEE